MTLSRSVILFIARVDESLVSDEKVAAGKSLCADVTHERLLFSVSADVSLEMFLQAVLAHELGIAEGGLGPAVGEENVQALQRDVGSAGTEGSWIYCLTVSS